MASALKYQQSIDQISTVVVCDIHQCIAEQPGIVVASTYSLNGGSGIAVALCVVFISPIGSGLTGPPGPSQSHFDCFAFCVYCILRFGGHNSRAKLAKLFGIGGGPKLVSFHAEFAVGCAKLCSCWVTVGLILGL